MTTLILIRHGQTDWNIQERWQGQADVPLNATGIRQASEIARSLSGVNIDAIYASDLQRAQQTAQAVARMKGLPIRTDSRLREIHQGEWQGLHISEIEARYVREFQSRRENPLEVAPPGGETAFQVKERVVKALDEIIARHPGETVAVVSHGFAIAMMLVHYLEKPIEKVWELVPRNGAIILLDVSKTSQ